MEDKKITFFSGHKNKLFRVITYLIIALVLRLFVVELFLKDNQTWWLQVIAILIIFVVGIGFVFNGTTKVIEETTDVLKDRTNLGGGLLQAIGTALPDMMIGVVAAFMALEIRSTDYAAAVGLAIVAASATFGSNIYNILHSVWCVYRQNVANTRGESVLMFPPFKFGGSLRPIKEHSVKPSIIEMDGAINVLTALTLLTAFVATSMVLFGKVNVTNSGLSGDVYQLIVPVGIILFLLCIGVIFYFRKSFRPESPVEEIIEEECYYDKKPTLRICLDLALSGLGILFAAESMVDAINVLSALTHIPLVIAGVLAGVIGCFGEMIIVHNYSIHPKGRIGDAVTGVAMDNIITTLGASIVAIMGGIFFGGNSLVIIFIIILTANTLLVAQISKLKNGL